MKDYLLSNLSQLPNIAQASRLCCHDDEKHKRDACAISVFLFFLYGICRRLRRLSYIIFLSLIPAIASSQVIVASGIVRDENNQPLVNCHITVKNTNLGTVTNAQGQFKLKIPEGSCETNLLVSYVGYHTQSVKLNCRHSSDIAVRLKDKIHQLQEIIVNALSPSQIVIEAIGNLEKNHQVDSVIYTMFSRITETKDSLPVLMEELVFDLFQEKRTKPTFYIEKIRVKGFNKLGKNRLMDNRLIDIHVIESHIMLRYLPSFLKKSKMKRYNYQLIDEVIQDEGQYYVISVTSLKKNYPDSGIIRIHKKNYGISYLEERFFDEHWRDMSHLNSVHRSYYKQNGNKWYFVHGTRSYDEVLKDKNITINHKQVTVATDRVHALPDAERQEMGLMTKMLEDFTRSYDDEFWENYNFIPLENRFKDN